MLLESAVSPEDYPGLAPLLAAIDRTVDVGSQRVVLPPTANYHVEVLPGQVCSPPYEQFATLRTVSTTESHVTYTRDGVLVEQRISASDEPVLAEVVDALAEN